VSAAIEDHLQARQHSYIDDIVALCRIASVSTDPAYADGIAAAADALAERMRRAGFPSVELIPTGGHPAVLAEWPGPAGSPTILVYGHYDVQPPDPLEKWTTPAFEPTIRDGRLYARGVSDDKAPMLIPVFVAEAFGAVAGGPPVTLKMLVEGEEETGSPHLEATVERLRNRLACDLVVSADGAMWRKDLPSVTVASRGLVGLEVTIHGARKDLHSGRHGGSAPNPVRALVSMLASLHDANGNCIVAGFADELPPPDPAVTAAIRTVAFDAGGYFDEIGAPRPSPLPSGEALLTRQWLMPTLEFNGISGGYAGSGSKTVIPSEASVKITCRLVAGQEPDAVAEAIRRHLEAVLPDGYRMRFQVHGPGTPAFAVDPALPALGIAEEVLEELLGRRPLRVAMGATIPVGAVFTRQLGVGTIFFSFSTSDEDYHAPNEFFRLDSLATGLVAWTRLIERLGAKR
jgi:acetylornithine deacetylase/succinyl-diaminopimelate desuccinylase-like protein